MEYIPERRVGYPKLYINIGWNTYEQKCIGGKDGKYEFELTREVLDCSFNNVELKSVDIHDPGNPSSLLRGKRDPIIMKCKELENKEYKNLYGTGYNHGIFYYSSKERKVRDICKTLYIETNYDVGYFEINITRGLRNRITRITPAYVIYCLFPISAGVVVLFMWLLWILYFIEVVLKFLCRPILNLI